MRIVQSKYKYIYYLFKFGTFNKLLNVFLNKLEYFFKISKLKSLPYKITIDPGNICNLRCPGCHTGIKHQDMITPSFLKFEEYKLIFDQVKNHAFTIALYNWGEPFLNKDIFKIIKHSFTNKVGTTIHSNFNFFNEDMAINSINSGLTHIYLSIDGASQEAYEKYRVKGNLEKVLNNVKLMVDTKKKLKSTFPLITWKFLVFEHNKHEIEQAREMARSIGVDYFEVFNATPKLMDLYEECSQFRENPIQLANLKKPCKSLWSSIYIQSNGMAMPCSLAFKNDESFGNLLENKLKTIWNNSNYYNSRKMFKSLSTNDVPLPCNSCKYSLLCHQN